MCNCCRGPLGVTVSIFASMALVCGIFATITPYWWFSNSGPEGSEATYYYGYGLAWRFYNIPSVVDTWEGGNFGDQTECNDSQTDSHDCDDFFMGAETGFGFAVIAVTFNAVLTGMSCCSCGPIPMIASAGLSAFCYLVTVIIPTTMGQNYMNTLDKDDNINLHLHASFGVMFSALIFMVIATIAAVLDFLFTDPEAPCEEDEVANQPEVVAEVVQQPKAVQQPAPPVAPPAPNLEEGQYITSEQLIQQLQQM